MVSNSDESSKTATNGSLEDDGDLPFSTLGDYIRRNREANGYSLAELAYAVSISTSALSQLQNNRYVHLPSTDLLDRLHSEFGGDKDLVYMLAGYWPPTVAQNSECLNEMKAKWPHNNSTSFNGGKKNARKHGLITLKEAYETYDIPPSTLSTWIKTKKTGGGVP